MAWPPQSRDLNPIELVLDKLNRKVKGERPGSALHCGQCFKIVGINLLISVLCPIQKKKP